MTTENETVVAEPEIIDDEPKTPRSISVLLNLGTYQGMTDEEIEAAADALADMSRFAEEQGAKFIFTAAPNKKALILRLTVRIFYPPDSVFIIIPLFCLRHTAAKNFSCTRGQSVI